MSQFARIVPPLAAIRAGWNARCLEGGEQPVVHENSARTPQPASQPAQSVERKKSPAPPRRAQGLGIEKARREILLIGERVRRAPRRRGKLAMLRKFLSRTEA